MKPIIIPCKALIHFLFLGGIALAWAGGISMEIGWQERWNESFIWDYGSPLPFVPIGIGIFLLFGYLYWLKIIKIKDCDKN